MDGLASEGRHKSERSAPNETDRTANTYARTPRNSNKRALFTKRNSTRIVNNCQRFCTNPPHFHTYSSHAEICARSHSMNVADTAKASSAGPPTEPTAEQRRAGRGPPPHRAVPSFTAASSAARSTSRGVLPPLLGASAVAASASQAAATATAVVTTSSKVSKCPAPPQQLSRAHK